MKNFSKYLALAAVGAGLIMAKRNKSVSGVGYIDFDNGLTFADNKIVNLKTCSLDELVAVVEDKTENNAHWDARMSIAYWCAWHSGNDDDFLKYLDLASALRYLEKEPMFTPNLSKARIAITQVIDNLMRKDFGAAAADRVWKAL